ncbi:hypothetical protein RhiirA1_435634 [Rhizophagus irregularis]|uniref:Uncharacterized protein n=1 Tax=Rhizophagus irregularis TaxID=588596 RepID=A0A2N0SLH4_9GLOM|nr:hypothetical protein RhiirA1_435634 [Rhizophagus irregularis]
MMAFHSKDTRRTHIITQLTEFEALELKLFSTVNNVSFEALELFLTVNNVSFEALELELFLTVNNVSFEALELELFLTVNNVRINFVYYPKSGQSDAYRTDLHSLSNRLLKVLKRFKENTQKKGIDQISRFQKKIRTLKQIMQKKLTKNFHFQTGALGRYSEEMFS